MHDMLVRRVLQSISRLPQVTLASIDGICVGGGLAVATHCDLRVCTKGTRFGYPIARTLGSALSKSTLYRCVDVFGESLTREMLLVSRLVGSARAYAAGAVMLVVPTGDELSAEVQHIVGEVRSAAPLTLATTKAQLLQRVGEEDETAEDADLLRRAYGSADFREGVRAFLAHERPAFGPPAGYDRL